MARSAGASPSSSAGRPDGRWRGSATGSTRSAAGWSSCRARRGSTHRRCSPPRRVRRSFRPLVTTYGVTRTRDVDPTLFAAVSFVVMFGMMFGDVGHGLRARRDRARDPPRAARGRLAAVPAVLAVPRRRRPRRGGRSACCTARRSVRPASCRRSGCTRSTSPVPLLVVARRGRRGAARRSATCSGSSTAGGRAGRARRCSSPTGVAGLPRFARRGLVARSARTSVVGRRCVAGGRRSRSRRSAARRRASSPRAGGGAGLPRPAIEFVDAVVRIGSNVVSFTRLAAFGLMHAALGAVVFAAAGALWGGVAGCVARACWCSSSGTSSPSRWRSWSTGSRRCVWSSTSCSPGCSRARAIRSAVGAARRLTKEEP